MPDVAQTSRSFGVKTCFLPLVVVTVNNCCAYVTFFSFLKTTLLGLCVFVIFSLPPTAKAASVPYRGATVTLPPICDKGERRCGSNGPCIPQRFWCDRQITHCPNGEDEDPRVCHIPESFASDSTPIEALRRIHNASTNFIDHQMSAPSSDWASPTTGVNGKTNDLINDISRMFQRHALQCYLEKYPPACQCKLGSQLFCQHANLTAVPAADIDIRPSANLTKLWLSGNNISTLPRNAFQGFTNLLYIDLANSSIHHIEANAFDGLPFLEILDLNENELTSLVPGTFNGLENLIWLNLSSNRLSDWQANITMTPLSTLSWLDLNHNQLTLQTSDLFQCFLQLKTLEMDDNVIEELGRDTFNGLHNLTELFVSRNLIKRADAATFVQLTSLRQLELTNNKLKTLPTTLFSNLRQLRTLKLSYNPIEVIPPMLFKNLTWLTKLNLEGIRIRNVRQGLFDGLVNLKRVRFQKFHYCNQAAHVLDCSPKSDGVSSFERLLVNTPVRLAVWAIAMLTCVGNVLVLVGRLLMEHENRVHALLIINLCTADLLMGIYLLIIAIKDLEFDNHFSEHSYYWMNGFLCQICGMLALASSEISVLTLVFMSIERFVCITHPLGEVRVRYSQAALVVIFIWVAGFMLAVFPIVTWDPAQVGTFYGENGVCFPLRIHEPFTPGWVYSAVVLIGVNTVGIIIIITCYVAMFLSILNIRRATHRPGSVRQLPATTSSASPALFNRSASMTPTPDRVASSMHRDFTFAKRFLYIIAVDCLCWIPIILVKTAALCEIDIPDSWYAWIVVFFLPINSAIDPILYTLTTQKFVDVVRRTTTRMKSRVSFGNIHHGIPYQATTVYYQTVHYQRQRSAPSGITTSTGTGGRSGEGRASCSSGATAISTTLGRERRSLDDIALLKKAGSAARDAEGRLSMTTMRTLGSSSGSSSSSTKTKRTAVTSGSHSARSASTCTASTPRGSRLSSMFSSTEASSPLRMPSVTISAQAALNNKTWRYFSFLNWRPQQHNQQAASGSQSVEDELAMTPSRRRQSSLLTVDMLSPTDGHPVQHSMADDSNKTSSSHARSSDMRAAFAARHHHTHSYQTYRSRHSSYGGPTSPSLLAPPVEFDMPLLLERSDDDEDASEKSKTGNDKNGRINRRRALSATEIKTPEDMPSTEKLEDRRDGVECK